MKAAYITQLTTTPEHKRTEHHRYFTHATRYKSDALYVRHTNGGNGVVMTAMGEREPHTLPWTIAMTLEAVAAGLGVEITAAQATRLLMNP